jgi:hypothetical protein
MEKWKIAWERKIYRHNGAVKGGCLGEWKKDKMGR